MESVILRSSELRSSASALKPLRTRPEAVTPVTPIVAGTMIALPVLTSAGGRDVRAVDPVCGIQVDEKAAQPEEDTSEYSEQVFLLLLERQSDMRYRT